MAARRLPRPDHIPEGSKWCTSCREVKPVAAFCRNKRCADGLAYWCRRCLQASVKDYERTHYRQRRDAQAYYRRRRVYGSNLLGVPIGAKPGELKAAAERRKDVAA